MGREGGREGGWEGGRGETDMKLNVYFIIND